MAEYENVMFFLHASANRTLPALRAVVLAPFIAPPQP